MGLLDILNGISNSSGDPRSAQASQGMSPIAKALLGLLAVYAAKNVTRSAPNQPAGEPGGGLGGSLGDILGSVLGGGRPGAGGGPGGGGLGDVLGSVLGGGRPGAGGGGGGGLGDVLGGLLGGGAAGSALNGGLGDLLKQFQQNGLGDVAHSWVGTGPNKAIAPDDLASALGSDTINALSKQTGLGRDDLLAGLSQHLPGLVDKLTPHGRLPTPEEAAKNL